VRSVDAHFDGRDASLRAVFDKLCGALERTGPLHVDAAKTSIHLVSLHHFGGVTVRQDSLRVGFLSDRELRSPRLTGEERLGPRRFAYHVVVRSPADVDRELLGWMSSAQAMQSKPKTRQRGKA
jgi:hypothetical protein